MNPGVYVDRQGRTAVVTKVSGNRVEYVPLVTEEPLEGQLAEDSDFLERYKLIDDYPPQRAVDIMVGFTVFTGMTEQAARWLGRVAEIKPDELSKSLAAASTPRATKSKDKRHKSDGVRVKEVEDKPLAKPAPKRAARTEPTAKAPVDKGGKKPRHSAAQMFKDLILEGKLTDDQIFEAVQKEFGLSDDKRRYVNGYRGTLIREGKLTK